MARRSREDGATVREDGATVGCQNVTLFLSGPLAFRHPSDIRWVSIVKTMTNGVSANTGNAVGIHNAAAETPRPERPKHVLAGAAMGQAFFRRERKTPTHTMASDVL